MLVVSTFVTGTLPLNVLLYNSTVQPFLAQFLNDSYSVHCSNAVRVLYRTSSTTINVVNVVLVVPHVLALVL